MSEVSDRLLVSLEGGVKRITFNNPARRNSVDFETMRRLTETIKESFEDETRVIVITGAGDSFCAGADLQAVTPGGVARDVTTDLREVINPGVLQNRVDAGRGRDLLPAAFGRIQQGVRTDGARRSDPGRAGLRDGHDQSRRPGARTRRHGRRDGREAGERPRHRAREDQSRIGQRPAIRPRLRARIRGGGSGRVFPLRRLQRRRRGLPPKTKSGLHRKVKIGRPHSARPVGIGYWILKSRGEVVLSWTDNAQYPMG